MNPHPTVGRRYTDTDHYEVGREKVRDFARAVQDFHPAHWDDAAALELGHPGLIAPATFASAVGSLAQRSLMRAALDGYDPARLLHVEQDIHCHRPVIAGDRLTHQVIVDSRRPTASGDLIAVTTVIRDQAADVVQTVHTTLAGRAHDSSPTVRGLAMLDLPTRPPAPARPTPPVAAPLPSAEPPASRATVPRLAGGQFFPPRTFRLSRGELVHYAGVSGDINPIHWNDDAARQAGLDAVAAHGMLVMGLGATCLTEWLGAPGLVLGYYVQFARPVLIGTHGPAEITFDGVVRSVDPTAGRATISLTAHRDGAAVFGIASATVRATVVE
ncbi:fused (3R)-hydroxyacyl-ACP dehydratase subunits HadA/HadB [Nocardia brevicatena]|uniref:fused (3R)-hydroxyacyl-ACP dehydratase subunits HadA/HadB n=1 Tax=Nocardia brevicatena TaxID=37327 RepID=UPI0002EEF591|nr:fused (3R)-hydroxyacyl-ACP dehydratase subunits HadA/HadB [Nocardia brevicatena]